MNDTKRKKNSPTPTQYALVAVASGVLGLMAVPEKQIDPEVFVDRPLAQQVYETVEEFRAKVAWYDFHHVAPAGYAPHGRRSHEFGTPSEDILRRQFLMSSNEFGETGPPGYPDWRHGPYMLDGMLENPVNGLESVRVLPDHMSFPVEADGSTGWIYQPATGEVRANAEGVVTGTKLRYFDI